MPLRWPSVKAALSAGASGTHDAFTGSATAFTGWQGSAGCLAPVLAIASFAPLLPTTQARRVFTFYLPTEALEAAAAALSETSR
jgi:hypothetical protein